MRFSLLSLLLIFSISVKSSEPINIPESLLQQVEQGNAEVAYFIATQFVQKLFEDNDEETEEVYDAKAKSWMKKAAEMHYPQAMFDWAEILKFDEKETEALEWYQKASELGMAEAKARIAFFHLNGLGGLTKDCTEAYQWYEEAQVYDNKFAYNDHAWSLATSPNKACRSPERALLLISKLMALYKKDNAYISSEVLDTQAAVYAGVSDFNQAIKIQKMAIEKLSESSDDFDSYQDRLKSYQQRKPWIQKNL